MRGGCTPPAAQWRGTPSTTGGGQSTRGMLGRSGRGGEGGAQRGEGPGLSRAGLPGLGCCPAIVISARVCVPSSGGADGGVGTHAPRDDAAVGWRSGERGRFGRTHSVTQHDFFCKVGARLPPTLLSAPRIDLPSKPRCPPVSCPTAVAAPCRRRSGSSPSSLCGGTASSSSAHRCGPSRCGPSRCGPSCGAAGLAAGEGKWRRCRRACDARLVACATGRRHYMFVLRAGPLFLRRASQGASGSNSDCLVHSRE